MEKYLSLEREAENEIVIERSRFITYVAPAENEEQARSFIEKIKKRHSLATHNCSAFVVEKGMIKRSSDDGEPSGTAGVPILDAILSQNLVDCVVVVTRYFGGIKLGAGGLVRAYSKSASEGLKCGGIVEYEFCQILELNLSYDQFAKVNQMVATKNLKVVNVAYGEGVIMEIAVPKKNCQSFLETISDLLKGDVRLKIKLEKFENLKNQSIIDL